ncbi:hypothetical protein [Methylobacterium sp. Leaf93]|uniref:hypothetical protein n=1 Tax=Methylobacterium sp. Leaf93 TaxID=1736249 RepID=UPI000A584614|nr:hypothetical protein [Methylobacterium sp. Leaf93]
MTMSDWKRFFLFAHALALITVLAQPAAAKKTKAAWDLGGCWTKDMKPRNLDGGESPGSKTLCFGKNGRLGTSIFSHAHKESFQSEGQYRGSQTEIELLGFPGDGWVGSKPLERCTYSFGTGAETMTLSDCSLVGEWTRTCRAVSADLSCTP